MLKSRAKGVGVCLLSFATLMFCVASYSAEVGYASNKLSPRSDLTMKIRIDIEGQSKPVLASLKKSPATMDLIKQLPLTLEFTDYAGTEKIANPPHQLSIQGSEKGYAGKLGDITYYAPWGNLAIFYQDSEVGMANGLIYLGKMDAVPSIFSQHKKIKAVITEVK